MRHVHYMNFVNAGVNLKDDSYRERLMLAGMGLAGEAGEIERVGREASRQKGVEARVDEDSILHILIGEGLNRSRVLIDVLNLVAARDLSLEAIHSGRNATENAYLQLLQEDQAHGFDR